MVSCRRDENQEQPKDPMVAFLSTRVTLADLVRPGMLRDGLSRAPLGLHCRSIVGKAPLRDMSYCSSQPFGKKAKSGEMSCTNAMSRLSPPSRCRLSSIDRRTPSIGSSLTAGFISGSPRFNYGKGNFKIPVEVIEKRAKLRPRQIATARFAN